MVEIGIKAERIEIMCWMLCSFTVLLREVKAEVNSPCGEGSVSWGCGVTEAG